MRSRKGFLFFAACPSGLRVICQDWPKARCKQQRRVVHRADTRSSARSNRAAATMPSAAPRPCTYPGCGQLVSDGTGRCSKHAAQRLQDRHRGSSTQRGYGYRWQQASKGYLAQHPLCQCPECDEGRKRLRLASVVDHKIPHRGDMNLFWDRSNWQAMDKACHDKKTATEDGGFGNAPGGGAT